MGLNRTTYYYQPVPESAFNLQLMRLIDEQYLRTPFYGWPKMTAYLNRKPGYQVNHKRVQRLMRLMGLQAIYPKRRTSVPAKGHKVYPYLLRNLAITRPNQVWSTDITYIPMLRGFMYLVAIMDWYSRYVVTWQLSNTLDGLFCLQTLDRALAQVKPEIFNTDQGAQFTALEFTSRLEAAEVRISMDGRGRALDNVFIERLWRSVKYEHVYCQQQLKSGPFAVEKWTGHARVLPSQSHDLEERNEPVTQATHKRSGQGAVPWLLPGIAGEG